MESALKVTLYVVNTFAGFDVGRKETGYYALVHPQVLAETKQYLFRQYAPSRLTAMRLMETDNKVRILDEMFGAGKWEIKFKELRVKNELNALKKWTDNLIKVANNKEISNVERFNITLYKLKKENGIHDMDWMKMS